MRRIFGYRSFMPEYEAMKRFRKAGVNTVTLMLSNGYTASGAPYTKFQPIWVNDDEYDFDMIRQAVDGVLDAVPDARIIFYIDLNSPIWWFRRNYFRCDSYTDLGKACADPEWIADTEKYFTAVLTFLEREYADHVEAYLYTAGRTTEWFDKSLGTENIVKLEAYQEWCRKQGFPVPDDIPPYSVREACPRGVLPTKAIGKYEESEAAFYSGRKGLHGRKYNGQGFLRTPADNPEAVRYWRFCNELIADTVIHFAEVARKVIRKDIPLGTVYGYAHIIMSSLYSHTALRKAYESPYIDFFVAPATYADRKMGGGSGNQLAVESLRLLGKDYITSSDHRTYTSRNLRCYDSYPTFWNNDAEVTAGMRREFSMNFVNGSSTWWFDMMGGWWDSDAAMAVIRRGKEIWDEYAQEKHPGVYELFFALQPMNTILLNQTHPSYRSCWKNAQLAANRTGVPFAFGCLEDLKLLDTERVKFYVFTHPYAFTDEELALLREKVLCKGHTVMWLYGPGVVNHGAWDEANVEKLCGFPFGTPGVNVKDMGDWTSVYLYDYYDLTPEVMFDLVRRAGLRIWNDRPDVVFANDRFAATHTAGNETIRFAFPRRCAEVTELFTGETWKDVQEITLSSEEPFTWLFKYE